MICGNNWRSKITRYADIPGTRVYLLPPMFVGNTPLTEPGETILAITAKILRAQANAGQPANPVEALALAEGYQELTINIRIGQMFFDWIRQCMIEFGSMGLQKFLPPNLWPNFMDAALIHLLEESLGVPDSFIRSAVGCRLMFRKHPEISCFTMLGLTQIRNLVSTAYEAWLGRHPDPLILLPPSRFTLRVIDLATHPLP